MRRFATILMIALGLPAVAQVTLDNSVQKVERFVAENGELEMRLVAAHKVIPGDELRYTIAFENTGDETVDAQSIVITNPIPASTEYIDGTAFGSGTRVEFSVDSGEQFALADDLMTLNEGVEVPASARDYTTIRWTFEPVLVAGAKSHVAFNVRLK